MSPPDFPFEKQGTRVSFPRAEAIGPGLTRRIRLLAPDFGAFRFSSTSPAAARPNIINGA